MSVVSAANSRSSSTSRRPPSQQQQKSFPILQSSSLAAAVAPSIHVDDADAKSSFSDVSASSSVGWSGDYCKKMMALNWDYTCGPLRVVQVGPHNHHWARLHAPGYAVLPRADGTLQHFREAHKHVSDADLLRQVLASGVGKLRRDPRDKLLEPVQRSIRDDDIDALKTRLTKSTLTLPPARPPQTDFTVGFKHFDDASSVFSQSAVGSKVASVAAAAFSGRRASSSCEQQQQSTSAARPSSREQFHAVANQLSQARSDKQTAASELSKAKEKLAAIEKIVDEHELSSKRASRQETPTAGLIQRQLEQKRETPAPNNNSGSGHYSRPVLALNQKELTCNLNVSRRAVNPFC